MFYEPLFRDPPKTPPPKFPPPCAKFGDFWDPPRTPPFFEGLAPDPLGHDPWPPSFMNFFDLVVWSFWVLSSIMVIFNNVMFINFIYKHDRLLAMHQGAPSCMRLHDSSSRVLLQKNTFTLPITMAPILYDVLWSCGLIFLSFIFYNGYLR